MSPLQVRGLTLIELLLTITILSIALGIAIPSMAKLIEQSQRKSALNELMSGINYARASAITTGVNVTLCPLASDNRCSKDWTQAITIFQDPRRIRRLETPEKILRVIPATESGMLYGRTGRRSHFGFRPTGMARESIGHLLWCPKDRNPMQAFQIRINMGGRPILAQDLNGDGIVEDAYGHNIVCP